MARLKALVLDSVSLPIASRVYNMALDEFLAAPEGSVGRDMSSTVFESES
jgi:hypothetical protein